MFEDAPANLNPVFSIANEQVESNITFYGGTSEMIKITEDGFYVRGKLVPIDEKEAETVYRAFQQFLIYHALTKEY